MKQEKLLQVVNLSPSEDWVEKLTEVHPMKQIVWASIVQVAVFGFMLLSFWGISIGVEAEELDLRLPETDYDFRQIEEDGINIINSERNTNFNIENPRHKYFLVINALDIATTYHATQQGYASEANPLLSGKPSLESLIAHKILWTKVARYVGLFWEEDENFLKFANILVTLAVINNTIIIIDNE